MSIEKQVVVQLKVQRPRDGAALADAAREAEKLRTGFERAGLAASKALTDAAAESRNFQAQVSRGSAAVSTLTKELAKAGRESSGIERVAAQLKAMGVGADTARNAAVRLMRSLGDGARVAEADVRRLAATIRQTGGAGLGGAGAGGRGLTMGGFIGGSMAMQAGRSVLSGITQTIDERNRTSADESINESLRRESGFGAMSAMVQQRIPGYGSLFRGAANSAPGFVENLTARPLNWLYGRGYTMETATPASAAASGEQVERLRRQYEEQARRRRDRTARGLAEAGAAHQGQRALGMGMIEGHVATVGAGDRASQMMADRRFERMGSRFGEEMAAAGRGEGVGGVGTGAMSDLQRELRNRPDFDTGERERIRLERRLVQTNLDRVNSTIQMTGGEDGTGAIDPRLAQAGVDIEAARSEAIRERVGFQQQSLEIGQRDVERIRRAGEFENQRLERFRQFAQQAEQTYRRIGEQERQRVQSFREQFGLMDEMGRAEALQLARRATADEGRGIQQLSNEEIRSLQGTGLMDEQVRGEANRRADAAGFGEFRRLSGADQRIAAATQRANEAASVAANIDNQITVNVQVNAADVARQVNDQLLPAIQQLNLAMGTRVRQEVEQAIAANNRQIAMQNNPG